MNEIIAKVLTFFVFPSHLMLMMVVLGSLLIWSNRQRIAKILLSIGTLGLVILGFSPLGQVLMLPLEDRFPPADLEQFEEPAGIIVLGGGVDPRISVSRQQATLNAAGERLLAGVQLYRRYPSSTFIYSGGAGNGNSESQSEAGQVKRYIFPAFGIPLDNAIFEHQSRSTYENAWFTKKLLDNRSGQTWLLVTSAYHMPRAMGVFRKAGFRVSAWPTDYRMRNESDRFKPFSRMFNGLRRSDTAVREWLALGIYWLTGKTNDLFPGPESDQMREPNQ